MTYIQASSSSSYYSSLSATDLKSLGGTIATLSTRALFGSSDNLRASVEDDDDVPANKTIVAPEQIVFANKEQPMSHTPNIPSTSVGSTNEPRRVRFTLPPDTSSRAVQVSFSPKARVRIIPSQREMSKDLKANFWRTPEETTASHKEVVKTVKAVRAAGTGLVPAANGDFLCARGLENLFPIASLRLKTRREELTNAVLTAQEKEWKEGCWLANPEYLRAISILYTSRSAEEAIMRGAKDEAQVRGMRRQKAATAA